jgi:hypothetical protein
LGAEQPGDVQVLCDRCHRLEHLLGLQCERGDGPVFDNETAARYWLDRFPDLASATVDTPRFCTYCEKMRHAKD